MKESQTLKSVTSHAYAAAPKTTPLASNTSSAVPQKLIENSNPVNLQTAQPIETRQRLNLS